MSETQTLPVFTPKPTETLYHLNREGNEEASQVEMAFLIANDHYLSPSDQITVQSIGSLMKNAESAGYSVRGFWRHRFGEEWKIAQKLGLEGEDVGGEGGIWLYRFRVKPKSILEALRSVKNAFWATDKENRLGLMRIFDQNRSSMDFDRFADRLKPQNLDVWQEVLCRNVDQITGKGHKEWNARFDRKLGRAVDRGDQPKFEVKVAHRLDLEQERDFAAVAEKQPVAKVILVSDDNKNVSEVEIMLPHFTGNEDHGRPILNNIAGGFEMLPRPPETTHILRVKERKHTPLFDLDSRFELGKEEERLIKMGEGATKEWNSLANLAAETWLAITHGRSAYICVRPKEGRPGDPHIPSDLTFALLPGAEALRVLEDLVLQVYLTAKTKTKTYAFDIWSKLAGKEPKILWTMDYISQFMVKETTRAEKALATITMLRVYLPQRSQKFFQVAFKKQNQLVSEGTFQVSNVEVVDDPVPNKDFITAHNIYTQDVLSILNYRYTPGFIKDHPGIKPKKVFNLRTRTDKQDYLEAIQALKAVYHLPVNRENLSMVMKRRTEEKVKNLRLGMAVLSFAASRQRLQQTNAGKEKIEELHQLFNRVSAGLLSS